GDPFQPHSRRRRRARHDRSRARLHHLAEPGVGRGEQAVRHLLPPGGRRSRARLRGELLGRSRRHGPADRAGAQDARVRARPHRGPHRHADPSGNDGHHRGRGLYRRVSDPARRRRPWRLPDHAGGPLWRAGDPGQARRLRPTPQQRSGVAEPRLHPDRAADRAPLRSQPEHHFRHPRKCGNDEPEPGRPLARDRRDAGRGADRDPAGGRGRRSLQPGRGHRRPAAERGGPPGHPRSEEHDPVRRAEHGESERRDRRRPARRPGAHQADHSRSRPAGARPARDHRVAPLGHRAPRPRRRAVDPAGAEASRLRGTEKM
ncbi:MAG: ABC transporter, substrate-binding protein (cluster 9, phospholipid), partial [uncultured Sphingosinicella sp.]